MSKELIELAKEHGRVYEEDELHPREPLHIIFFSYDQLEAFAKAYQSTASIENVAETLKSVLNDMEKANVSRDTMQALRGVIALIPTQANRTEV
jgi:hypothetical protein